MRIKVPVHVGMKAYYKVEFVHSVTGVVRPCSDWTENVMLTSGMLQMSQRGDWFNNCQIGIDSTEPNAGFTNMPGWVAGTANVLVGTDVHSAQPSAPYYGWRRKTFRFPSDSVLVSTPINRVGVGWGTTFGSNLVSLAEIVDVTGTPVAPNWQPGEYVDVTVEMRYYPPLTQIDSTVVLDSVTYDYSFKSMIVTDGAAWGSTIGGQIASYANTTSDWLAYDNNFGATIEDPPTGNTALSDTTADYTNAPAGLAEISFGMSVGPTAWNLATGLLFRSLQIKTTAGWYQIQFDSQASPGNGIPKTDQFTMQVEFVMTWGQATIP